jgi:hypothetical protein
MNTSSKSFSVFKNLSLTTSLVFVVVFHTLFAFQCNKPHEAVCIYDEFAPIASANVPDSGLVNTNIPIPIQYNISNGCGHFLNMEETIQGNTRKINVNARYEGCVCTMVFMTLDTVYNFNANTLGTYYLNFNQGNNNFLRDSITIQ